MKFPENWPVFSPKDKIADWLEMYTRVMELNYWTSTIATRRALRRGRRRVGGDRRARRRAGDAAAQAAGARDRDVGQARTVPTLPGQDVFRASSSTPPSIPARTPTPASGCVVIGSNNSAFDICGALYEDGADVTMVQRSSTHIVRSSTLMEHRPAARCTPRRRSPPG